MLIPNFLAEEEYLQNPLMRRFLKEYKIKSTHNKSEYIAAITDFANQSKTNEDIVTEWLLKVTKEGSKEFCYKRIQGINDGHTNPAIVERTIKDAFPDCPQKHLLAYKNTDQRTMIEYHIITNDEDAVNKIDFTFSNLFLCGESWSQGNKTVYPVFVEVYLDKGFIVGRAKAKSTVYRYDPNGDTLLNPNAKVDTVTHIVGAIDSIIECFGFQIESNPRIVSAANSQMLYRLYQKYSFTPADVEEQVESQNQLINGFINQLFNNLSLDFRNKEKAILDAKILAEKFISINGNNEEVFKNDRPAYLIKVSADDESELTKIDTSSNTKKPLQCTEAFFDSKKAVVRSKTCKRLNLVFKRSNELYFSNPLNVQISYRKKFGYVKTTQYAEEVDIQYVLQTIFENY